MSISGCYLGVAERIMFESFWLGSPAFADVFAGVRPVSL